MSDWIKEEAEKTRKEREAKLDKEYIISLSNYWAELRSQIEKDIKEINEDPVFHDLFRENVTIENAGFGGICVRKISFPGAFKFEITNGGDELTIKGYYKRDNDRDYEDFEEKLSVVVERGHVSIKTKKGEVFIVPEQASRYVLATVVRAKDDSRQFFDEHPYLNR